jgi:hypothetical protein
VFATQASKLLALATSRPSKKSSNRCFRLGEKSEARLGAVDKQQATESKAQQLSLFAKLDRVGSSKETEQPTELSNCFA